jgi:hypothetical protein
MPALEVIAIVVLLALPWLWLVRRELARLSDSAYLRAHGVVIISESALQGHAPAIGEYMGHPIWASVRFMEMDYRFDRVQPGNRRECLAPRELFIDPGLVYVTE